MSDTLYSNLVAWLSHCPLAWHTLHPALCVLKRTVALEGLRCAFVRIYSTNMRGNGGDSGEFGMVWPSLLYYPAVRLLSLLVHSCLGHSESYNTYSLRAVECNLKWIPWQESCIKQPDALLRGERASVWGRDYLSSTFEKQVPIAMWFYCSRRYYPLRFTVCQIYLVSIIWPPCYVTGVCTYSTSLCLPVLVPAQVHPNHFPYVDSVSPPESSLSNVYHSLPLSPNYIDGL